MRARVVLTVRIFPRDLTARRPTSAGIDRVS